MSFQDVLNKYRQESFSKRDEGDRFEHLMKGYLLTDPKYQTVIKDVWMWSEFNARDQLGSVDTGIDLVAKTFDNKYWAIQCKCYSADSYIQKSEVDTFLSTSGRKFIDEDGNTITFNVRLWISTTDRWSKNAEETLVGQTIPVVRLNLSDLEMASVNWDALEKGIHGLEARKTKYDPLPHQSEAILKAHDHFLHNDRGKMIMACGTGKTFTSLRIIEDNVQNNGLVLFLAPSIALVGQTLREWTSNSQSSLNIICVCSDAKVTKSSKKTDEFGEKVMDLGMPATTDPDNILYQYNLGKNNDHITVVFSTYQSIDSVIAAQKNGLPNFDFTVCDEAHRTTGAWESDEGAKSFSKVHSEDNIHSSKRLYMTATPRIYSESSKKKAEAGNIVVCSMDDESIYGKEFYRIGFGEAVDRRLLTDYKVLIFTVNEKIIPPEALQMMFGGNSNIDLDAALKLIGCISALSKVVEGDTSVNATDPGFMKTAVAFCNKITNATAIAKWFNDYSQKFGELMPDFYRDSFVKVSAKEVNGSMSMPERDAKMSWLKDISRPDNECRILTNVRCLSEGVDVPSLDAVMFLSAKNSQIDVVQSVGRVMRKSPGKNFGYIVIPIVVSPEADVNKELDHNENYKTIWTVLNALRAHDERFEAIVNKLDLMDSKNSHIIIGGLEGGHGGPIQTRLPLNLAGMQNAIYAKLVQKVGDKMYWSDWASDVAKIAQRQIDTITYAVNRPECSAEFKIFLENLCECINPDIGEAQAIEMLSQHIITSPVFDALFENYSFVDHNPVSISMNRMLKVLCTYDKTLNDLSSLEKFYDNVRKRASGIDNAEGRQKVVIELYNNFFKAAFPKMAEQLGIVYTPVQIVDFIIASVNDVMKKEFGKDYNDEYVNILDPFTGTGTFITRLIQSGLISKENLPRKYKNEIFANEIVLLAYYIAAVNIENAYHDYMGNGTYVPFEGICLTDTFESMGKQSKMNDNFGINAERIEKMQKSPINIIFGNPPYSVGQNSTNDNLKNRSYPIIDKRMGETYVKYSDSSNKNRLYDSYIRAFRYATDRIGNNNGIICFVSNGGWLDGTSAVGFRKSLVKEFAEIYVFNLRGNQRTKGERSRMEGGKVFGEKSRTPVTITLLVKRKDYDKNAIIHYHDIGFYKTTDEKLKIVKESESFLSDNFELENIVPSEQGDWITERNPIYQTLIKAEPEKKYDSNQHSIFLTNTIGINTSRDAWSYNFSKEELRYNMTSFIDCYNQQTPSNKTEDKTKIAWSRGLENLMKKGKKIHYSDEYVETCIYRPFVKMNMYRDDRLVEMCYQNNKIFPTPHTENMIICVNGIGMTTDFGCYISNCLVNIQVMPNGQCFPLYWYEPDKKYQINEKQKALPGMQLQQKFIRHDAISDWALDIFTKKYGKLSKEDIFFYIYGILHNNEYRNSFSEDFKKELARIPLVDNSELFWTFSKAGRELANLHINYEKISPYSGINVIDDGTDYSITEMKYLSKKDKTTIIYNNHVKIENIPLRAYDYVINGRSAIDWIVERYQIKEDKRKSYIVNNPNGWLKECGDSKYILNLLLSIINVSMKTLDIIDNLPKLSFETNKTK